MDIKDCIYPDCQIKVNGNFYCEHSCEWEKTMKRPRPKPEDCLAGIIPGGMCQFPYCDC